MVLLDFPDTNVKSGKNLSESDWFPTLCGEHMLVGDWVAYEGTLTTSNSLQHGEIMHLRSISERRPQDNNRFYNKHTDMLLPNRRVPWALGCPRPARSIATIASPSLLDEESQQGRCM